MPVNKIDLYKKILSFKKGKVKIDKIYNNENKTITLIVTKGDYVETFSLSIKDRPSVMEYVNNLIYRIKRDYLNDKETLIGKDKVRSKSNGEFFSRTTNGVHDTFNTIFNQFKKVKLQNINSKNHKPEKSVNHVGIEFEFYSSMSRDDLCEELFNYGIKDNVRIKTDRSIQPTENKPYGYELCLLTTEKNKDKAILDVCEFFKKIGAECNASCGLHVHLDMRNRDVVLSFNRLYRAQTLLYSVCNPNRASNQYCARLLSDEFVIRTNDQKYFGINTSAYRTYKTLEVRTHEGTIKYYDVINWVNLLLKIIKSKEINVGLINENTLPELSPQSKIYEEFYEYFKSKEYQYGTKIV